MSIPHAIPRVQGNSAQKCQPVINPWVGFEPYWSLKMPAGLQS
jgi:hypothetical protein